MVDMPDGTGDPRVDGVLLGLARVTTAPVTEHVAVFEETLDELERVLASAADQVTDPTADRMTDPTTGPMTGLTTGQVTGWAPGSDPLR